MACLKTSAVLMLLVAGLLDLNRTVAGSIERSSEYSLRDASDGLGSIDVDEIEPSLSSSTRQAKFFPFYTIGRFQNTLCTGSNQLAGTCVLGGECADGGGIATGTCSTLTRQAVCCVYQSTCGATTDNNNTYFVNPGYPGSWAGGSACGITVQPCGSGVCQLRIDFLDAVLATPNGDGVCNTDLLTITGGATTVPPLCGDNTGQHVYVDFDGTTPIQISVSATPGYTFARHWNIKVSQINCDSAWRAPSGCLQYYSAQSGVVRSFNYGSTANAMTNAVGLEGSRQLANQQYGVCVRRWPGQCSITWSQLASDPNSFSLTGDVGAVDPTLLGTVALQQQDCTTDYIVIPNPAQAGALLPSDRFCGLGLAATTSNVSPFTLFVVTDGSETMDIGNRGFALNYAQNLCSVI